MDVRSKSVRAAWLLAALTLWPSCISKPPEGRLKCQRNSDCPSGWFCHDDLRCYAQPAADSGTATSAERNRVFYPPPQADAAMKTDAAPAPSGGAGGAGGAGGEGATSGGGGSSGEPAVDAGPSVSTDAGNTPVQMIALGAYGCETPRTACERSADCVGDRCLITTCEAPGTFCDGPAECCDLACKGGKCKCGNHSSECSAATTPCCSGLYCETGQCATCKAQGESCEGAYQCCGTTDCYDSKCQCRPMGATCNDQSVCCAGTRCDGGQCTCRAEGATCDSNSICCSGLKCSGGMCVVATGPIIKPGIIIKDGVFFPRFACMANDIGEACTSSSDCCSENCFDNKCVAPCLGLGATANVDNSCCSRVRDANGKCAYAGCYAVAHSCSANLNCCSGRCVSSACAP